jgi:hypothetical protein
MATGMAVDVDVDVATDMDVELAIYMATDMDADVADDMEADSPCFHWSVSSGPNIFGLLIISIQPIFIIQSIFSF